MTTVRLYDPQDEQQLREIASLNYTEQFQDIMPTDQNNPELLAYLAHMIQTQDSGKGIILLAEQKKRLTGFVCLLRPDNNPTENGCESAYAFMSDLFVIPECRHQGVGSQLTMKLEEQAQMMGATNIALRVAAENEDARHFYIKEQYQEKFVVMSKELAGHEK